MTDIPLTMASESERLEFQTLVENYCAAWTTLTGKPDLAKVSPFYAKDADIIYYDVVPPREGYQGWENLKEGILANVYPGLTSLVWTSSDVWAAIRGAIALTGFNWTIATRTENGTEQTIEGRMTMIWEKRDEGWVIIHEHSSVPFVG